jgi:mannose-1-phosphate guanylyltransferase
MPERYVVIMAGGKGERFWPQSRLKRPKQLLPIVGDSPLLTQTVDRLAGLVPPQNVFIITNEEQAAAVAEACPQVPAAQIVAEPEGRDTAAAVGLGALLVRRRAADASFAVLPADHVIHDSEGFRRVMRAAFEAAESQEALVTVGIEPSFPATGYGYIQRGEAVATFDGLPVHGVRRFVEKPDEATARGYVNSGDYFWNAGMFIWRAPVVCAALERHAPGLWQGLLAIDAALSAGTPLAEALRAHYPTLKKISVDYALMEKADNVRRSQRLRLGRRGCLACMARTRKAERQETSYAGVALCRTARQHCHQFGRAPRCLMGVEDCDRRPHRRRHARLSTLTVRRKSSSS